MKKLSFEPFPELETPRLLLRQMNAGDAEWLFHLRSDKDVMRWVDRPMAQSIEDAQKLIRDVVQQQAEGLAVMWSIVHKDNSAMIGCICFVRIECEHARTEVGYLLEPAYHRRGLMSEALNRVVDYGFSELGFHKITASVSTRNVASHYLLEKNGFICEGSFHQHYFWKGRFIDALALARYSPAAEAAILERKTHPLLGFHEDDGHGESTT